MTFIKIYLWLKKKNSDVIVCAQFSLCEKNSAMQRIQIFSWYERRVWHVYGGCN